MDKYKQLQCVQGLILSLKEEFYRLDTLKGEQPQYDFVLNEYYKAIVDFLNKE